MIIQHIIRSIICIHLMLLGNLCFAGEIWIDVRSVVEHKIDRIEGDVRISHSDIVPEVSQMFPDKATEINLYCRSGGRAGKALKMLQAAGYHNVKNIGGIDDARKQRGIEP